MTQSKIAVEVSKVVQLTPTIKQFEFISADNALTPTNGGGHITVHMDGADLKRSYSLTSNPEDTSKYSIAVLRDPASRGGSVYMHDNISEGDKLFISPADNFFPLVHDKNSKHILIAGGIGITPFMSYLYEIEREGLDFELHYCFREAANAAFVEELQARLGDKLITYEEARGRRLSVTNLMEENQENSHFYVCGPAPLIDDVIEKGNTIIGSERVHFEKFSESVETGDTFEVYFQRSGFGLMIEEDMSILQAIEADKRIQVECLCRNGVCGTCETTILEGEADHRDEYLDDEEREAQETMMVCVSRAKGERIVLDL